MTRCIALRIAGVIWFARRLEGEEDSSFSEEKEAKRLLSDKNRGRKPQ
jgi:hypothetical protein